MADMFGPGFDSLQLHNIRSDFRDGVAFFLTRAETIRGSECLSADRIVGIRLPAAL